RRHISTEVKAIALCMSLECNLPDKKVKKYTGISICSLKRLRATFRQTGELVRIPVCPGRPRLLDALDFLEACIERRPDMLLSEL
ncbi:hypothetical protein C8T65DRAFT_556021, partial [Cerioporus squamosus]